MGERHLMSHTSIGYGALAGAIALEVTATAFLAKSEQFTRLLPSAGVVLCYSAAFYLLSQALKALPLGVAYAIWASFGTVLIAIISAVVLRQPLDAAAMIGIGLIVAGVIIMNTLSRSVPH